MAHIIRNFTLILRIIDLKTSELLIPDVLTIIILLLIFSPFSFGIQIQVCHEVPIALPPYGRYLGKHINILETYNFFIKS